MNPFLGPNESEDFLEACGSKQVFRNQEGVVK